MPATETPLEATLIRRAVAHLKGADPKLEAVIERVGPCHFTIRSDGTHFEAVARAIVYQQLSGKAAATIYGRFTALFDEGMPVADHLLALSDEALRGVGLSRQKSNYLRDLATSAHSGKLPIDTLHDLDNEAILAALTSVKGIGRWTAQMFLMFRLGRLDVLPDLDLGIQKAVHRAYRLRAHPSPKRVLEIGGKWAPYRSIASWYLWRSLDPV